MRWTMIIAIGGLATVGCKGGNGERADNAAANVASKPVGATKAVAASKIDPGVIDAQFVEGGPTIPPVFKSLELGMPESKIQETFPGQKAPFSPPGLEPYLFDVSTSRAGVILAFSFVVPADRLAIIEAKWGKAMEGTKLDGQPLKFWANPKTALRVVADKSGLMDMRLGADGYELTYDRYLVEATLADIVKRPLLGATAEELRKRVPEAIGRDDGELDLPATVFAYGGTSLKPELTDGKVTSYDVTTIFTGDLGVTLIRKALDDALGAGQEVKDQGRDAVAYKGQGQVVRLIRTGSGVRLEVSTK